MYGTRAARGRRTGATPTPVECRRPSTESAKIGAFPYGPKGFPLWPESVIANIIQTTTLIESNFPGLLNSINCQAQPLIRRKLNIALAREGTIFTVGPGWLLDSATLIVGSGSGRRGDLAWPNLQSAFLS